MYFGRFLVVVDVYEEEEQAKVWSSSTVTLQITLDCVKSCKTHISDNGYQLGLSIMQFHQIHFYVVRKQLAQSLLGQVHRSSCIKGLLELAKLQLTISVRLSCIHSFKDDKQKLKWLKTVVIQFSANMILLEDVQGDDALPRGPQGCTSQRATVRG